MEILKQKTITALKKVQQEYRNIQQALQVNQEPQQNNEQNEQMVMRFEQLLQKYDKSLNQEQKMLLKMNFSNELSEQFTKKQFSQKITKLIQRLENKQKSMQNSVNSSILQKKKPKKMIKQSIRKTQPAVQSHPQYYRVDQQVANRLFEHYRNLALGVNKANVLSFEQKQQFKLCVNYHKILQIFKDAGLTLEINQKLLILRAIKKISFNQNMINKQQFIKIYKYIVHGLGYKQKIFQDLLLKKAINGTLYQSKKKKKSEISNIHKVYRFKTENSIRNPDPNLQINKDTTNYHHHLPPTQTKPKIMSLHNQSKLYESKVSKFNISKTRKPIQIKQARSGSTGSYLIKAMDRDKISKITWETLFAMKQNTMHYNISIPDIVRSIDQNDLEY